MVSSIREIGENIKNSSDFRGDVKFDVAMSEYTTMKTGGPAAMFIIPQDAVSALCAMIECKRGGIELFILGGGSNLVVGDGGMDRAVLYTGNIRSIGVIPGRAAPFALEDFDQINECCHISVTCGSGMLMNDIADWCARYGILGFQTFAGLPGTCGGAAFMNARCYEKNFGDIIKSVQYIDIDALKADEEYWGELELADYVKTYTMDQERSGWGYKKSPFQSMNALITQVTFEATCIDLYVSGGQTASPAICDYIRSKNAFYVIDREEKGHFKAPSAGSVFKNNREFGRSSGKIIDEVGLKGKKIGGAQVAPWHGNIIINTGNATAADVKSLVKFVQDAVKENTGCLLEPEVIFVGK